MTRRLLLVASAVLLGTASLAPMDTHADEQPPVVSSAARTHVTVPLPISRPVWSSRLIAASDGIAGRVAAGSGATQVGGKESSGVAPEPDGSGLKSGSAEALAVQLEGAQVLSSEGGVVGEVEKVIDQPGNGRQAVISVGGFLGIGESHILIPADNLVPSGKGLVRTNLTEKQLKGMPSYDM
jgi:hypothetical protein